MANKDKNANQEHKQHDDSNMELGEHQSGHIQGQQQGGKSSGTMTQTDMTNQHQQEGQHGKQGQYQQGSKMSTDEPAEGSRQNVDDDLKRQDK